MLLFIDFCNCHWMLPWLLPFILGALLGWLLKSLMGGKKETVIEEKIVYKDKIVYQDKIIYKDAPTTSKTNTPQKAAKLVSSTKSEVKAKETLPPPVTAVKSESKNVDKEDDYLPCKFYQGREVSDKKNNIVMFKHDDDGQYYFALYESNGSVKLRSEGFRTSEERDQELSGVLKFHNDESMYKTLTKGKYSMRVLYDKSGREVGRSCLIKESKAKSDPVKKVEPPKVSTSKAKVSAVDPQSAQKVTASAPKKKSVYSVLKNDNLQIVEGIGPKMDEVLKKHGVKTWSDLASKTPQELRILLDTENPTRYRIIDPTTWPDQAKLASEDKWPELISFQKRLDTGRANVGDGVTDAKVEKLLIKMGALKKWKQDDLKAVEGIGPKIAGLLNDAGITTWKILSETPVATLQGVLEKAGPRYKLADPGSWPKQAEFAAAGKWDDLQEYQDFLVGGK